MSLSIVIKGPEGLVLAAESRVTLTVQSPPGHLPGLPGALPTLGIGGAQTLSVSFDHATKLLSFSAPHTYVGAVTFGQAIIGLTQPRTPASFIPELEASLPQQRVPVAEFAALTQNVTGQTVELAYMDQWPHKRRTRCGGAEASNLNFITRSSAAPAPPAYARRAQRPTPAAPRQPGWGQRPARSGG